MPGENALLERPKRAARASTSRASATRFDLPIDDAGDASSRSRSGASCARIPYGETRSYEELATGVGRPGGSRAVGQANGRNRVAIVMPCHRVVNKSGEFGGYGGGLWRKSYLLDLERRTRACSRRALRLEAGAVGLGRAARPKASDAMPATSRAACSA